MTKTSQKLTRLAQEVVRLAPLAVLVLDEQKIIRVANSKAAELLADMPDESLLVHNSVSSVLPDLDFDRMTDSPKQETVLIGNRLRSIEFQCARLNLDDTKWTIVYFSEADRKRKRELLLEKEASTDELSGLANRRAFQRTMEGNQHRPLSLAIVDIDYFKAVNDQHGHLTGDDVVKHTSQLLRQAFDKHAILTTRMGGDEFSVLFETTDANLIVDLLDGFRNSIADTEVPDHPNVRLTVSIGAAISMVPGIGSRALLTHADRQLYKAKGSGRNSVSHVTLDESVPHE